MITCEICGNKRCPHALNHRNDCTHSNEPGQIPPTVNPPPVKLEKSIAEKLDGVKSSGWTLKPDGLACVALCVGSMHITSFLPDVLVALAREIVRRIDGEPVKQAEGKTITPPDGMIAVCRQVVTQIDGCDYRDKYNELVKRLNELKEG